MFLTPSVCACQPERADGEERYLHILMAFRSNLRSFKGCRLSVLLALGLHSDEGGFVSVSNEMLSAETGYNKMTVAYTIADLCQLTVNDHRVLVPCVESPSKRASGNMSYRLFPGDKTGRGEDLA